MKEKVAICMTPSGPTYRETAKRKLLDFELYPNHDNLYYFVITEDKDYFKDINRQNLIVRELKDFYSKYPELEKNEHLIESTSFEDWDHKMRESRTFEKLFPFSIMRFHLDIAKDFDIINVSLNCTDTDLLLNNIPDDLISNSRNKGGLLHNAVTQWDEDESVNSYGMKDLIKPILKEEWNIDSPEKLRVFDAAARFFVFKDSHQRDELFSIWNKVMKILYERDSVIRFSGGYSRNDEYILAPIYHACGIESGLEKEGFLPMFTYEHRPEIERPWSV